MISVICATNRPQNTTRKISELYQHLLLEKGEESQLLSLEDLPHDFVFNNEIYGASNPEFGAIVKRYIAAVDKLVIISPEYNGSIPGVFKAFIDGIWPEMLKGKKAAFVGVASGRAGNARGMDHLTNIFHYLEIQVLPYKVPISGIDALVNSDGSISDEKTISSLERQIESLVSY